MSRLGQTTCILPIFPTHAMLESTNILLFLCNYMYSYDKGMTACSGWRRCRFERHFSSQSTVVAREIILGQTGDPQAVSFLFVFLRMPLNARHSADYFACAWQVTELHWPTWATTNMPQMQTMPMIGAV